MLANELPQEKIIYLIRHGESMWNEAQDAKNVVGMLKFGHPLNAEGISQCQKFNRAWTQQKDGHSSFSDDEQRFFNVERVMASPLTRAVQTALVGLQGHPVMHQTGVRLHAQMRGIKSSAGSFDTTGAVVGYPAPRLGSTSG